MTAEPAWLTDKERGGKERGKGDSEIHRLLLRKLF